MKRFGIFVCLILLCLVMVSCLSTSRIERTAYLRQDYFRQTMSQLDSVRLTTVLVSDSVQAGFAKISITPELNHPEDMDSEGKFTGVPLAGYGARKGKFSTGIHDSIFVKAAALNIHGQILVLVTADLLIMPPNIIDAVSQILSLRGIRREQLYFSATHSHSSLGGWAPGFIGTQFAGKENRNIQKWLVVQISDVVIMAIADLRPASIGYGHFNAATFTRNRVIGESGTKNNDFSFIELQQIGHKKAIIGSFSAHSTTLGSDNLEISADYPGYWERKIEATSADLALFFAGSVGSQSPVGKGDGFEKPRFIGESLADSLNSQLPLVTLYREIPFSAISLKIHLPPYHIRLSNKMSLSTFLSKKLMPLPENVYLQAIRMGNLLWITTPADFSGEYALQLKNALAVHGFHVMVTSFNGSYVGYIVPGRYFYYDQYESRIMGWFGPHMGAYTMHLMRKISEIVTGTKNI